MYDFSVLVIFEMHQNWKVLMQRVDFSIWICLGMIFEFGFAFGFPCGFGIAFGFGVGIAFGFALSVLD